MVACISLRMHELAASKKMKLKKKKKNDGVIAVGHSRCQQTIDIQIIIQYNTLQHDPTITAIVTVTVNISAVELLNSANGIVLAPVDLTTVYETRIPIDR